MENIVKYEKQWLTKFQLIDQPLNFKLFRKQAVVIDMKVRTSICVSYAGYLAELKAL